MSDKPNNSASTRPVARTSMAIHASIQDISVDLTWVDMLKGIAIVGVFLDNRSYYMYLIHCPIMMFLIGPPLRMPTDPIVVIALGVVYLVVIFLLCGFISRPIEKLSSWAYRKYAGFEARKD